jgi:hypothetical protein
VTAIAGFHVAADAGDQTGHSSSGGTTGVTASGGSDSTSTGGSDSTSTGSSEGRLRGFRLEMGTPQDFCAGSGPPLQFVPAGSATPVTCTAGLTRRLFSYGICSCSDVVLNGATFALDSFDSRNGPYNVTLAGAAALGANGTLIPPTDQATLSGSVIVGGRAPLSISGGSFVVGGDLKTNGPIEARGSGIDFRRDVWADADIRSFGNIPASVGRDVYQTRGHTGANALQVGGRVQTRDFVVEPPCSCDAADLLDIRGIVAQARASNDDAAIGLDPNAPWLDVPTAAASNLPCGRFYLASGAASTGTAFFRAWGRTALFIDGDVDFTGTFVMDTDGEGELDVFIAGDLLLHQTSLILGNLSRPGATRFYVAGQLTVDVVPIIAAQIYAPRATLVVSPSAPLFGSLFASRVELKNGWPLHFDRAVLDVGEDCAGSRPDACDGCGQCPSGLACVAGACRACASDGDCCSPMACAGGICQLSVGTP